MKLSLSIRRLCFVLVLIGFTLAVLSILGRSAEVVLGTEKPHILSILVSVNNVNEENSIPTWYASFLLLCCALLLALIALQHRHLRSRDRHYWAGLALIFLYLSIDESAAIHERFSLPLQSALNATGPFYFAWVIAFIPLVMLFAAIYLRFWLRLPPRYRRLFLIAAMLYLGGAIGIEMLGANLWYSEGTTTLLFSVIGTVEECLEILGTVTFMYALLSYLAGDSPQLELQIKPAEAD